MKRNDSMTKSISQLVTSKIAISLVLLVVLWLWESWHPFFKKSPRRNWHAIQNLSITLFNTLLIALFFGALTISITEWSAVNNSGLLHQWNLSTPAALLLSIVLLDAWMYLWHRMNHVIPFLWRFHKTHHSDNRMDVTTTSRFHLFEQVFAATIRLGLIPLFGFQLLHLIVYDTLLIINTQIHHANISFGKWDHLFRLLFVTPDMHKIHHSRWKPETNSNYSVLFSFWDRLAFSFRMRRDPESIEFGLDGYDEESWQSFGGILKTPFVRPKSKNVIEEKQDKNP